MNKLIPEKIAKHWYSVPASDIRELMRYPAKVLAKPRWEAHEVEAFLYEMAEELDIERLPLMTLHTLMRVHVLSGSHIMSYLNARIKDGSVAPNDLEWFCKCWRECWVGTNYVDHEQLKAGLEKLRPHFHLTMTELDHEKYQALPDEVQILRYQSKDHPMGFAYCLQGRDLKVIMQTPELQRKNATVFTATIPKSQLGAYYWSPASQYEWGHFEEAIVLDLPHFEENPALHDELMQGVRQFDPDSMFVFRA